MQEKITEEKANVFWSPTLPSAKEFVRLILEATMQKHGVTKLFVSEAPSTEQLKKIKNNKGSMEAKLCYMTKILRMQILMFAQDNA